MGLGSKGIKIRQSYVVRNHTEGFQKDQDLISDVTPDNKEKEKRKLEHFGVTVGTTIFMFAQD